MEGKEVNYHLMGHLSGGLRFIFVDPNMLRVFPVTSGTGIDINLKNPYDIYGFLKDVGLTAFGTEEVIEDNYLPTRLWHPLTQPFPYGTSGATDKLPSPHLWAALSSAAEEKGDNEASEVMRYVSFSLQAASRRFLDISTSYNLQLEGSLEKNVSEHTKFSNLEMFDLFLDCHSFLTEACSARDYLAKFLAKFAYSGSKSDSMAKLLEEIRRNNFNHPIQKTLLDANEKGSKSAWMLHMSQYRNIVAHKAPLSYAVSKNSRLEIMFKEAVGVKIPSIFLGVPSNPFSMSSTPLDALELFHQYNMNLLEFSNLCAKYSPYEPLIRRIGPEEIISLEEIKTVRRF